MAKTNLIGNWVTIMFRGNGGEKRAGARKKSEHCNELGVSELSRVAMGESAFNGGLGGEGRGAS